MKKGRGVSYGATVLALSNILVKCIGLLFKIPLANLSGGTVLAYFNMAMSVFSFGMITVTAGLPTAAARMIAASPEQRRARVSRAALLPALIFGAISSVLVFLAAPRFALLAGDGACAPAIRAIAPGIFACCLVSVLRALRQGEGDMIPTALSQLIEAVMRLAVGLACAGVFAKHGDGMIAAGAAAGVAAGEICALVCLLPMLFRQCVRFKRSDMNMFPELARIALPLTVGSVIHTVANIADTRILLSSLRVSGLSGSAATELYGIYSGYCMTLFSFPPTLIAALTASLLPAAAALHAEKNKEGLSRLADRAIKTALLVAAPCAAGFLSIPHELLSLLFRRSADVAIAAPLLAAVAPGVIFLAISAVCRTLLIASGKAAKSVASTLLAAFVRIAVTALAARIPGVGIFGAALASGAALLVQAVADLVTLRRMRIVSLRLRAFMPAILLSLPLVIISPCMLRLLTPCLGADKATVFAVFVSAAVYLICGTFFGFINPSALLTLKTPKIVKCKKC